VLGALFLDEAQHRVDEYDRRDDERLVRDAAGALGVPHGHGDGDGDEQQIDERALELREQSTPGRDRPGGLELVGPVHGQALGRFLAGETPLWVGAQLGDHIGRIPEPRLARGRSGYDLRVTIPTTSSHRGAALAVRA